MKFGAKDYFEEEFFDYVLDNVDFLEVQGLRSYDYKFMKKYKVPIVVHAEHHTQGSNPADLNCKTNLASLRYSQKLADSFNGKKIILHPGSLDFKGTSKENSIKFIKKIDDNRILMENLITNHEMNHLCTTPEEMEYFMEQTGKGFIFDLAHAMITANYKKIDQIDFIKKFLKLEPRHFHISGQEIKSLNDEHRALHECDINWKKILGMYPNDSEITLEVTQDADKTIRDLKMIKNIARKIC